MRDHDESAIIPAGHQMAALLSTPHLIFHTWRLQGHSQLKLQRDPLRAPLDVITNHLLEWRRHTEETIPEYINVTMDTIF